MLLQEVIKSQHHKDSLAVSIEQFGWGILPGLLDDETLANLRREADAGLEKAAFAESNEGLTYRARMAALGEHALSLLNSVEYGTLLSSLFGGRFELTEEISCYTYYDADSHLGAHRDNPATKCAVTILIYVHATSPAPDSPQTGLVLNVYGREAASVGSVRLRIPTIAGGVVFGRGSEVWHERPRLQPGEQVIAITGCYRRAD